MLEVDTHAPKLHGNWIVDGLYSSVSSDALQVGALVSIDEQAYPDDTFSENLSGASIYLGLPSTYSCTVTGSAGGTLSSSYNTIGSNTATGTLTVNTTSNNSIYSCLDEQGDEVLSGAPAGLYIIGNQAAPWSPLSFSLTDTTLQLTSQTVDGVLNSMYLTRIP